MPAKGYLKSLNRGCTWCGKQAPEVLFYTRPHGGRDSICRVCRNYKQKQYRIENPDRLREIDTRWVQANRDKKYSCYHKRKSIELGLVSNWTSEEWDSLKRYWCFTCLACGRKEPEIRLTVDHVIPVSLGGSNGIENIQPLCRSCNSRKKSATMDYRSMRVPV